MGWIWQLKTCLCWRFKNSSYRRLQSVIADTLCCDCPPCPDQIGRNPGLQAIWEDEKQRRREKNQTSQIETPESQGEHIHTGNSLFTTLYYQRHEHSQTWHEAQGTPLLCFLCPFYADLVLDFFQTLLTEMSSDCKYATNLQGSCLFTG